MNRAQKVMHNTAIILCMLLVVWFLIWMFTG